MRYFFHIGYNGYNYHGWQRQLGQISIQEILEVNLSKVLKIPVVILGCGRTDAQVHASQYFFHMDVDKAWDFDLLFRLNKMLPDDIAVFDIIPVENNQHAQYNAVQRTYDYFIHTYKDPFLNQVSAFYLEKDFAIDKMKKAAILLTKYNDYRAFCKSPDKYEHTLCNISSAKLFSDKNGNKFRFKISSNRFLRGMIRAIVAQILNVGRDERSVEAFENLLVAKETADNMESAFPPGLFLSKVSYPFLEIPPRVEFSSILQNKEDVVWEEL